MRKLVFLLFILTCIFTINLLFYVLSEDYRFIIKKLKYEDTLVYDDSRSEISDSVDILGDQETVSGSETSTWKQIKTDIKINQKSSGAIALSLGSEDILRRFEALFDIKRVSQHSSLFGITSEYPDEYFEYTADGIALYFFPTKNYYDLRDIFDTLSFELPYRINQVNNFWDKSFYINLRTGFDDGYIRIVVLSGESVFWLKIKKDRYNEAKKVLENINTPSSESFSGTLDSMQSSN